MARRRIGEVLLEQGAISEEQLERALAHQRESRQRLGVCLVALGFIQEHRLVTALSEALQIPVVDLGAVEPEWSAVHALRARFCEAHDLFPFEIEDGAPRRLLRVAMGDPLDLPAIEEIEFTTGMEVAPYLAPRSAVRGAIVRWYHKGMGQEAPQDGMTVIQPGGVMLHVPDAEPEEVIEGEEIAEVEPEAAAPASAPLDALARDLDYLFGLREQAEPHELLERKFWALLRLLAKKGLITNEEFNRELEDGEG